VSFVKLVLQGRNVVTDLIYLFFNFLLDSRVVIGHQ
jgi:hypothetical protein